MAAALSPEQLAAVEQQLSQHPEIVQALQADSKKIGGRFQYTNAGDPRARETPKVVLQRYGIDFPDAADYQIQVDPAGNVHLDRQNWFQRNQDWVLPVATIATAGAASALTSGAAAAPSGAASGPLATGGVGPLAAGYAPGVVEGGGAAIPASLAAPASTGGVLGTLGKYSDLIGDTGQVVSEAAGGAAEGRRADANANARGIAENNAAKVNAARYNLDLPSVRTNQVARGEVLNTMQDAAPTGDPRIDKFGGGGLRPSAFGPQSRQAGAELSRQALGHLIDPTTDRLTPQEIPGTHASAGENIGAGVGLGASLLSLLAKYGRT